MGESPRFCRTSDLKAPEGRRSNSTTASSVAPSGLSGPFHHVSGGLHPRLNSSATSWLTKSATSKSASEGERSRDFLRNGALWSVRPRSRFGLVCRSKNLRTQRTRRLEPTQPAGRLLVTATRVMGRRLGKVLGLLIGMLSAGCSPEPATPPAKTSASAVASKSDAADDHKIATTSAAGEVPTPWSVETLGDGEFTLEEGFRPLSFNDFEMFFAKPPTAGQQTTWFAIHDAIVCRGKPKGYLYSQEKFQDFTLRLEFRFAPPAEGADANEFNPNTGVLVYITKPHKQWPKSLEVQGKLSELATIKPNGGAAAVELVDDAAARESARKPVGEWNSLEIVSKGGALTAALNGTKVCESRPGDISEGAIGLQSEDSEVHFRRICIRAE